MELDLAGESALSFPEIPICPATHKKEIERNLELSVKREERIFRAVVEHLKWKGFPVKILAWELNDIRGQAEK